MQAFCENQSPRRPGRNHFGWVPCRAQSMIIEPGIRLALHIFNICRLVFTEPGISPACLSSGPVKSPPGPNLSPTPDPWVYLVTCITKYNSWKWHSTDWNRLVILHIVLCICQNWCPGSYTPSKVLYSKLSDSHSKWKYQNPRFPGSFDKTKLQDPKSKGSPEILKYRNRGPKGSLSQLKR